MAPWRSSRAASWATVYLAPFVAICLLGRRRSGRWSGRGAGRCTPCTTGLTLISFLTLSWPISVPRYLMGVFTIFIGAGVLARRPWLGPPLFVASILLFARVHARCS